MKAATGNVFLGFKVGSIISILLVIISFYWVLSGDDKRAVKPMDYLLIDTSPSLPPNRFDAIKENIDDIIDHLREDRNLTIYGLSDNGIQNKVLIEVNPTANTGAAKKVAIAAAKQTWNNVSTQFFQNKPKSSPIYETLEDITLETHYDKDDSRIFIISDLIQISPKLSLINPTQPNQVFESMFKRLPEKEYQIFVMRQPYDFIQNNDSTPDQRSQAYDYFKKQLTKNRSIEDCNTWKEFKKFIEE